jgi:hypothetical protein
MIDLKSPRRKARRAWRVALVLVALAFGAGTILACGGEESTYVRGDDVPGLDDPAMSTGLDKRDLEELLDKNLGEFFSSRFYAEVKSDSERRSVAIFPFKNETSEHVGPQLQAVLSKIETKMVNEGVVDVVSHERQADLIRELQIQQSDLYDQARAADVGKRLGVDFFITGKVYDSAERTSEVRRVQYFLFMQAIDVETGVIRWQNEAELTKGLVPLD